MLFTPGTVDVGPYTNYWNNLLAMASGQGDNFQFNSNWEGPPQLFYNYQSLQGNYAFETPNWDGVGTIQEDIAYIYSGSFMRGGMPKPEESDDGLELAAKVYETTAVSVETTMQTINGAQKLANLGVAGSTFKAISLESKGLPVSMGLVSAGFTVAEAASRGSWENHNTADILITAGQVALGLFEATSPIGWAFGATMFVGNLVSEHYYRKSITEKLFD